MKISIITVSSNSAGTIECTIQSVLSQSYFDIEYIIVDGLSTDGTIDIVKQYETSFEGRLRWISEKDSGIYDAMNKGLEMATGDIVGILNSDDLLDDPDAIKKVMSLFSNAKVDSVYADLYLVTQNDINIIVRYWKTGNKKAFSKGWHPAHPTFYVKKKIYEQYGFFNLKYIFAADFELMLRLLERHQISTEYLPEPLVRMRLGGTTTKSLRNIIKGNIECYTAFTDNSIPVSILYPLYRLLPKFKQFFHNR